MEKRMTVLPTDKYNPRDPRHRWVLATGLLDMLAKAGFMEEFLKDQRVQERVFYRPVNKKIRVRVFTSIVNEDEVRRAGRDAIRVCAVYRSNGTDRGIVSQTRTHRTGTIEAILDRVLTRMRECWKACATVKRCSQCNAPLFRSKQGNWVCAELCWLPPVAEVRKPKVEGLNVK
jgi:hypothetical protein